MTIWQDAEPANTEQHAKHDVVIGRRLIMILVALAIFTGGMYLVYSHADQARPAWPAQISERR